MINTIKAPALAAIATLTLSGCIGGLLDVDNPNSLNEESVELPAAANGLANGALVEVADAVSYMGLSLAVASDEGYWTGSRDAWGQLDQGYVGDPLNEFTDAAFPQLGEAVWLARKAVTVLEGHVAELGNDYRLDRGRSHMFYGIALMITGESQEDMTFSDKTDAGPAVGPANMYQVLDDAIQEFTDAIADFEAEGETDLVVVAKSLRARAHMSRAIWDELNPTATVGTAITYPAQALTDAADVLTAAGGSDWKYNMTYSSGSISSYLHGEVNNRGEQQWDPSLAELTGSGTGSTGRTGESNLDDPFAATPGTKDPAVKTALTQFGPNQYGPITLTSARLMRLIIAENALATANTTEFAAQINALRDYDAYDSDYTYTAGNAVQALTHHRRVNTLWMGLRLQDMYRWGIEDPKWQAGSEAVANAGQMLPITIVECRANPNLDSVTCAPTPVG
jgi:hypothetical protein